ncbi:MAG TPA: PGPGW domain-containing protein [Actinomycetes bacterium]|nr:PGPGW domain-containing protein [Actinomycetes bacterium]
MSPLVRRFARQAWRVVVLVVGLALVAAGLVMLVTPGPGIAAVLAGLALLATEFAWARRLLAYARRRFDAARDQVRRRTSRSR